MDGGSAINILYYETFLRMNLKKSQLQPTNTIFHGIVPRKSHCSEGKITLDVAFGESKQKYRMEKITFEVVKLNRPSHALFGRPAFTKFMARPCYVYLQLKIPSTNGVITIYGSKEMAAECDNGDAAMVEKACVEEELRHYKSQVDPADRTVSQRTTAEEKEKFKPAQDTKMVDFTPGDSSQQFAIGKT